MEEISNFHFPDGYLERYVKYAVSNETRLRIGRPRNPLRGALLRSSSRVSLGLCSGPVPSVDRLEARGLLNLAPHGYVELGHTDKPM
jgi:hypothetical protein